MNMLRATLLLSACLLISACSAFAADVSGQWKAEFETQIGVQKYTFEFKVDGERLTGKAIGEREGEKAEVEIKEGKISGADISFVETMSYQGQELRIDYRGKISGDEIKFTRNVAEMVSEDLVAKRVKAATQPATQPATRPAAKP
jgi:hypothetical protein